MCSTRSAAAFCWLILLTLTSSAQTSKPPAASKDVVLSVGGEVARPLSLTTLDWEKLPRRSVQAADHGGEVSTFDGAPLSAVLEAAGVAFGEKLRGARLAEYLLIEAADGYRAVFALAEIDPAYTDRQFILADRINGKPLSSTVGPLRLIVPDEKRHGRWIRQVTRLTILHAPRDGASGQTK